MTTVTPYKSQSYHQVSVRLTTDDYQRLTTYAQRESLPMTDILRQGIDPHRRHAYTQWMQLPHELRTWLTEHLHGTDEDGCLVSDSYYLQGLCQTLGIPFKRVSKRSPDE